MQKVNFAFNPWPQLNFSLMAPGLVPPGPLRGRLSALLWGVRHEWYLLS